MAKKIQSFPVLPHKKQMESVWDKWLDGNIWQLTNPGDYETPNASMMQKIRAAAKRRHHGVRIMNVNDHVLIIQAHPAGTLRPGKKAADEK